MPFHKKRKTWKRKSLGSKAMQTRTNLKSKDFRFKGIHTYKAKPEPFPRVLYTRMKFAEAGNMTVASADIAVAQTYRANSIFDPSFSIGVGSTTAVGHSNMAALYHRYLVTGCKVVVSFNNPTVDGARVGYRLRIRDTNACAGSTVRQLQEQPMTYMSGINDSGSQRKNFAFYIRPWTLRGVSKLEYFANTSLYSAEMAANPPNEAYFDIFVSNPNEGVTISYVIKIIYYVQLYDRRALSSSIF